MASAGPSPFSRWSANAPRRPRGLSRRIGIGLVVAALFWLLGAVLAEGFYTKVLAINHGFWDQLWGHNPPPQWSMGLVGLLLNLLRSVVLMVIGIIGGLLLIGLLIISWLAYQAERVYLFPVVGFFVGYRATGWFAQVAEVPVNVVAGVAEMTALSASDIVVLRDRRQRLIGLLGMVLGLLFFGGAVAVLGPMVMRGAEHRSAGEAVVRHLPTERWITGVNGRNWSLHLIEVSATKQRVEVALMVKNQRKETTRIGIDGQQTFLAALDSPSPITPRTGVSASTGVPLLPRTVRADPNAQGIARLSFPHPGKLAQRWDLHLRVSDGGKAGWSYKFLIDLRENP